LIGTRASSHETGRHNNQHRSWSIVDEVALIPALSWIQAAALNVFEKEPLDPASPLVEVENVILTSHSIGWTGELFRDMGRIDCEGAPAIAKDQLPANVVNPDLLRRPGFQRKLEHYQERFK
jgi:phosphoglycerate dehydrogenase-like enzyme